ncbi:MAG: hypothetical protein HYS86_00860 [Candidatus Chisholmbacteria bacterium]|nr:hypothetical protein [Candidatus Chisholmbacteria bacterium]
MKRTIISLILVFFFALFLPNRIFADYTQDLDACHKILSKSSSDEYCTLHINAEFEGNVGSSKLYIANAYIYPESGVGQATKSLEEKYKSRLKQWQSPEDSGILDSRERELYKKVIEEAGPDNMRFLIKQIPDEGFYTIGKNIVYDFRIYLYMQQGVCVIVMDGGAGRGYIKNQNNRFDDVDGDIEKLKKESIVYMNKVGNDLTNNCKKDTKSDFQKVAESDFEIVYPVPADLASPKQAAESVVMTSGTKLFLGVVGGGGEVLVEFPNGDDVTVEEKQAIDIKFGDLWKEWRFFNRFPQNNWKGHVTVQEVDCHILLAQEKQDQETLQRLGEIRSANRYDLGDTLIIKSIGDCSYINEGGPVRALVEQGEVTIKTTGGVSISTQKADFGIGYDTASGQSIIEIYHGSATVSNQSGQSKNISTVYGSQINRIEVSQDGAMTEKIAIPGSEWEAFLASQQTETESKSSGNALPILVAIIVLGIGGTVFFLYRKGKLMPLYRISIQKISELMRKTSKNNKRQETD